MSFKTFNDLEFKLKTHTNEGKHARLMFRNGWGVSVITGNYAIIDKDHPYELAVLKDNHINYDHIESQGDVVGYLTAKNVTTIMIRIQMTNIINLMTKLEVYRKEHYEH